MIILAHCNDQSIDCFVSIVYQESGRESARIGENRRENPSEDPNGRCVCLCLCWYWQLGYDKYHSGRKQFDGGSIRTTDRSVSQGKLKNVTILQIQNTESWNVTQGMVEPNEQQHFTCEDHENVPNEWFLWETLIKKHLEDWKMVRAHKTSNQIGWWDRDAIFQWQRRQRLTDFGQRFYPNVHQRTSTFDQ